MGRKGRGNPQNGAASASVSTEAMSSKDDQWLSLDDFEDEVKTDIFQLLKDANVKTITANIVKELEDFLNVGSFMKWMPEDGKKLGFDSKTRCNILSVIEERVKANTAEGVKANTAEGNAATSEINDKMDIIEIKINEALNSQSARFENQLQAINKNISELKRPSSTTTMTSSGTQIYNSQLLLNNIKTMDYSKPPFEIETVEHSNTFDNCSKEKLLRWFTNLKFGSLAREKQREKPRNSKQNNRRKSINNLRKSINNQKQTKQEQNNRRKSINNLRKSINNQNKQTKQEQNNRKKIQIEDLTEPELHEIFSEIVDRLVKDRKNINFVVHHEHPLHNKLRPDFIFVEKNMPTNPFYCSFVAELQVGTINLDHKGRMFQYHEMFLLDNPCRPFVTSMVTNLNAAVIIKTSRIEGTNLLTHFEWREIPFWLDKTSSEPSPFTGIKLLKHMIKNPKCVGYENPKINFEINGKMFYLYKFLSEGTTANAYLFRNWDQDLDDKSTDYVLKVFKSRDKYLDELAIINDVMERIDKLNDEHKPKAFLRKIENPKSDAHNAIVYNPKGSRLEKLTKCRVKQMFECVGKLHEIGVIHRDISPNHFFVINRNEIDEQVFLIDYGSAYCMKKNQNNEIPDLNKSENENAKYVDYNGSVHFASLDILKMLNEGRRLYKPKRRQDIESLIRTIMYFYYQLPLPSNISKDNYADAIKFWKTIDNFLQEKGQFQFWGDILVKVRNGDLNLEEIINHFDKLFFLDLEDISKKFNSINL